jgi:acetyl-CoA carboxylase carboxyl transferase subunit alpha
VATSIDLTTRSLRNTLKGIEAMPFYYLDFEKPIAEIDKRLEELRKFSYHPDGTVAEEIEELERRLEKIQAKIYGRLTRWQRTQLSRHFNRPTFLEYVERIFTDFIELHGDRKFSDDPAIVGGLARFHGSVVMLVGHEKGRTIKEKATRNVGMPNPEGYRKALRLMKMAEQFQIPVITMIDTPGAFPGPGAEERGQAAAIAENLLEMARLEVPILSAVIGEGGSGGALALGLGDRILMLENATYSVISPEGCAAILWKSEGEKERAAEALKGTAADLLELGVIDEVVPEPIGGAHRDAAKMAQTLDAALFRHLQELRMISKEEILRRRYEKFRKIGQIHEGSEDRIGKEPIAPHRI